MNWFKFYGQEFLTDPKMMSLTAIEKALWITMLCLASQNDGKIQYIDQYKIMILTGMSPLDDEWDNDPTFFEKFEELGMITVSNGIVTITHWGNRQQNSLTNAERQARFRAKHNAKVTDSNENSNARVDKIREDKRESIYNTPDFLLNVEKDDLEEFTTNFVCTPKQVQDKATEIYNRIKAKGQSYEDYRALLINILHEDFGDRKEVELKEYEFVGGVAIPK